MASYAFIVCILAAAFCTAQAALSPRPCPGGLTPISDLTVSSNDEPCTKFPCDLYKGKDTEISLKVEVDDRKGSPCDGAPHVLGTVGGVPLPWAVPAADGFPVCEKVGNMWLYKMRFPVSDLYPSVRSIVTWKINKQDGTNIFCFRMAVALKALQL